MSTIEQIFKSYIVTESKSSIEVEHESESISQIAFKISSSYSLPIIKINQLQTISFSLNEITRSILCLILILLFIKYKKQQNDSKRIRISKKLLQNNVKEMPTPAAMPIIGHIHLLRDFQHNPWEGFNKIREEFGHVVSLKMGIHPMALVSSSEAMSEILLKKGEIFSNRPNFPRHHIIFGGDKENSLALCDWSNTHRDRRKLCKRGIVPNKFSARNQLLEEIIIKHIKQFINNIIKTTKKQLATTTTTIEPQNNNNPKKQENFLKTSLELGLDNNINKNYNNNDSKLNYYFRMTKENLLFLTSDIFMEFLCKESHSHLNLNYKKFVLGCDFVFWDINQCYLIDFLPFLTSLGIGFTYLKRLKNVTDFLRDYIDDNIFEPRLLNHKRRLNLMKKLNLNSKYDDDDEVNYNCSDEIDDGIVFDFGGEEELQQQQQQQQLTNNFSSNFKLSNSNSKIADINQKSNDNFSSEEEEFNLLNCNKTIKNDDYLDSIILEYLTNKTSMSLADYKVGFADLLAGHAAVANILIRLLGHLALDKSIQDLIYKEAIENNLDNSKHMPSLPVTEASLQEALRLASSPIVPHVAREDTSIDKFYIPQGTVVLFNNYHLNLSETLWKNPHDFNPRRFLKLTENGQFKLEKPKHFMPFSAGLRQCLGYKMVESTTMLAVANLCKEFVIKANNEDLVRKLIIPKGSVALNPDAECFELNLYPR